MDTQVQWRPVIMAATGCRAKLAVFSIQDVGFPDLRISPHMPTNPGQIIFIPDKLKGNSGTPVKIEPVQIGPPLDISFEPFQDRAGTAFYPVVACHLIEETARGL